MVYFQGFNLFPNKPTSMLKLKIKGVVGGFPPPKVGCDRAAVVDNRPKTAAR